MRGIIVVIIVVVIISIGIIISARAIIITSACSIITISACGIHAHEIRTIPRSHGFQLCVSGVWQGLQCTERLEEAHVHAHRRASLQVRVL